MEEGSSRSVIAAQIARFRQTPPLPKDDRDVEQEFWWLTPGANKAGQLATAASSEGRYQNSSAAGLHASRATSTCLKGSGGVAGPVPPADALQQLIASNPALLEALTNIDRDEAGRISNGTLERIRNALDSQAPAQQQLQQQAQQRLKASQTQVTTRAIANSQLVPQATLDVTIASTAAQETPATAATRYQGLAAGQLAHPLSAQQTAAAEQAAACAATAAAMAQARIDNGVNDTDMPDFSTAATSTVATGHRVPIAGGHASAFSNSYTSSPQSQQASPAAVASADADCWHNSNSLPSPQASANAPAAAIPVPGRGISPAISSAGSVGSADGSSSGMSPAASSRMASMRNSLSLSIDVSQHVESDSSSDAGDGSSSATTDDSSSATSEHCQEGMIDAGQPDVAAEDSSGGLQDSAVGSVQRQQVQPGHLALGSTEHLSRPWEPAQKGGAKPGRVSFGEDSEESSPQSAAAPSACHNPHNSRKSSSNRRKKSSTPGGALHQPVSIFCKGLAAEKNAGESSEQHRLLAVQQHQQHKVQAKQQQEKDEEEQQQEGQEDEPSAQQQVQRTRTRQQQGDERKQWGHKMSQRPSTPGVSLGKPVSIFSHSGESCGSKATAKSSKHSSNPVKQEAPAAADDDDAHLEKQRWAHKMSKRPSTPGVGLGKPVSIFSASGSTQQAGAAAAHTADGRPRTAPAATEWAADAEGSEDDDSCAEHLVHFTEPSNMPLQQVACPKAKQEFKRTAEKQQQWGHKLSNRPPTPGAVLGQPVSIFSDNGARSSPHNSHAVHRSSSAEASCEDAVNDERIIEFQPDLIQQSSPEQHGSARGRAVVRPQSAPGTCSSSSGNWGTSSGACVRFKELRPKVQFNPRLVQPGRVPHTSADAHTRQHTEQQWGHKLSQRPPTPGDGLSKPVSIFSESGGRQQLPRQQHGVASSSYDSTSADDDISADEEQHVVRLSDTGGGAATLHEAAPVPNRQQAASHAEVAPEQQGRHWHQKLTKRAPTRGASLGKPVSIFSSEGSTDSQRHQQIRPSAGQSLAAALAGHNADLGVDLQEVSCEAEGVAPEEDSDGAAPAPSSSKEPKAWAKLSKRPSTPGASLAKPVSIFSSSGSTREDVPASAAGAALAADVAIGQQGQGQGGHTSSPMARCAVKVSFSGRYNSSKLNTPAAAGGVDHSVRFRSTESDDDDDEGLVTASAATALSSKQQQRELQQQYHQCSDSEPSGRQESRSSSSSSEVRTSAPATEPLSGQHGGSKRRVSFGDDALTEGRQSSSGGAMRRVSFSDDAVVYTTQQQPRASSAGGRRVSFDAAGPVQIIEAPQQHPTNGMHRVAPADTPPAVPSTVGSDAWQRQPEVGLGPAERPAVSQQQQQQQSRPVNLSVNTMELQSAAAASTAADSAAAVEPQAQTQQQQQRQLEPAIQQDPTTATCGPRVSLQQVLLKHNPDLALDKQQQADKKQRKAATTPGAGLGKPINVFKEETASAEAPRPPSTASVPSAPHNTPVKYSQGRMQHALLMKNADLALEQQQQVDKKKLKAATTPGAGLGKPFNMFKDTIEVPAMQQPEPQQTSSRTHSSSVQQALMLHNADLALEQQQQQERNQKKAAVTPGAGLGRPFNMFRDDSDGYELQQHGVTAAPAAATSSLSSSRSSSGSLQLALLQHNPDLALEKQQQLERKQAKVPTTPGAGLAQLVGNIFADCHLPAAEAKTAAAAAAASASAVPASRSSLQDVLLQHNPELALEKQQQWERKQAKVPTTPGAGLGTSFNMFKDDKGSAMEQHGRHAQQAVNLPSAAASSTLSSTRGRSSSLKEALLQHNSDLALEQQQQRERQQAKVPTTPGAGLGRPFNLFKDSIGEGQNEQHQQKPAISCSPAASPVSSSRGCSSSLQEALLQHNQDLALEKQQQWERKQAKVPTTPGAGLGAHFNMFKDSADENDDGTLASPVSCPSPVVSSRPSRGATASGGRSPQGSADRVPRAQSPDPMAAARHSTVGNSSGTGVQHQTDIAEVGKHDAGRQRGSSPLRSVTTAADVASAAELEAALAKRSPLRRSSNSFDPDPARLSPLRQSNSTGTGSSSSSSSSSNSPPRRVSDGTSTGSTCGKGSVSELTTTVPLAVSIASPSGNSPGRASPQPGPSAAADPLVLVAASPQRSSSRLSRNGSAADMQAGPVRSPSPLSRTSNSDDHADTASGCGADGQQSSSSSMPADVSPSRLSTVSVAAAVGSPLRHSSSAIDPLPARASPLRRESTSHSNGMRGSWDAA